MKVVTSCIGLPIFKSVRQQEMFLLKSRDRVVGERAESAILPPRQEAYGTRDCVVGV